MRAELRASLADHLLALADDELILAHRNSEWTGHAPILEEDIAFSNLALDEMGHAQIWYQRHAELVDRDPETYPDELVFHREASFFRNARMVELPNGDWALTVLRQFLFDALENVRLAELAASRDDSLARSSAKIATEELYHLRHSEAWVRRLGLGTDESHGRMQRALDVLWPYGHQFFEYSDGERRLEEAKLIPAAGSLKSQWLERVMPILDQTELSLPEIAIRPIGRQEHSEHLVAILSELQQVARAYPQVDW